MRYKKCGSSKIDSQWGDDEHGNCGDVYTCRECGRQWDDKEETVNGFSRPMPQTDMSAHDLTLRIGKMFCEASKIDARKTVTMDEAIDKTDKLITQRDRDILTKAAERVREKLDGINGPDYEEREAIIASIFDQLDKTDKGE